MSILSTRPSEANASFSDFFIFLFFQQLFHFFTLLFPPVPPSSSSLFFPRPFFNDFDESITNQPTDKPSYGDEDASKNVTSEITMTTALRNRPIGDRTRIHSHVPNQGYNAEKNRSHRFQRQIQNSDSA